MPVTPVKKLTIITFQEYEDTILTALGRKGIVELKPLSEEEFGVFRKATVEELRDIENLLFKLEGLREKLDVPKVKPQLRKDISKDDLRIAGEKLTIYEKEIEQIQHQIAKTKEDILYYNQLLALVGYLEKSGIPLARIRQPEEGRIIIGLLGNDVLQRVLSFLEKFSRVNYKVFKLDENRSFLFLEVRSVLEDYIKAIVDYLKLFEFNPVEIPEELPPDTAEAKKWLEDKINNLNNRLAELTDKLSKVRQEFLEEAPFLNAVIRSAYAVAKAKLNMLRSATMSVLQGWIPEDMLHETQTVINELKSKIGNKLLVFYEDPLPHEEVPTVMRVPSLFKPYESMIRQYGVPDPHETDPTIISGILWTIMFGFMFPDFGQGLVIMLLGVLFTYVLKRNELMGLPVKKLGKIMIGAGLSAAFFGLLVGDFFLTEHVIHPLWPGLAPGWVEKSSNVVWLLKIAIYFGILQITLALLIAIYNSIREGHYLEALLGEKGLAGLITFWSFVLMAFAFLGITVIPEIRTPWGTTIPRIAFPELKLEVFNIFDPYMPVYKIPTITFLVGIILMLIKPIMEKEGVAMAFGGLLETVIAFMSNMLSYTRLAGFNIAHVALAVVIARLLEVNPLLGIGMGLIFLNIFALTLEFLVVMIQALRLVFYEFMTKFYRGTGRLFKPFRIL
ncbi:MAG: V-type ATP synthase subunit I [Candidatus Njordarchaeales archaeon]